MRHLRFVFCLMIFFLMTLASIAQENISVVIDVRFEGVEIRRDNSDLWLPLPRGAIAFIGAGDTIRTDDEGRVDILFDENAHMLLLSNSDFTVTVFQIDDDRLLLEGMLNGTATLEVASDDVFDSFNFNLNDLAVIDPATLMSFWSFAEATDAVTVAQGNAIVNFDNNEILVMAESGFFADGTLTEAIPFKPEWSAAALESILYGCEGIVQTASGSPLLVRTGPGRGFQAMGTLDVSRIVQLLSTTETTGWTRIQFLSGFGWIQSSAINSECINLPTLPDDTPEERFITIINVRDDERVLLEPFFTSPANNAFTYKFVANP